MQRSRLGRREPVCGAKEGLLGPRALKPEFPYEFANFSSWGLMSTQYVRFSWDEFVSVCGKEYVPVSIRGGYLKIKLRGRKGLGEGLMTDGLGHFALLVYGFALPQGRMLIDERLMFADSLITESRNQKPIEIVAQQRARERTNV